MKLRAKQRKFIIFGFGILAALVLIYVLLAQQFNSKGTIDNLENKQEQYSRYLEIGKLEGPYLLELDEYKNRLQEDRTRFLEGDNPNVAKSELMKVLIDFAEKNGVEVTSRTPQNEEKIEDKLYKISARLQTRCNSEDLVRFLTDIRNYSKFLTMAKQCRNDSNPDGFRLH